MRLSRVLLPLLGAAWLFALPAMAQEKARRLSRAEFPAGLHPTDYRLSPKLLEQITHPSDSAYNQAMLREWSRQRSRQALTKAGLRKGQNRPNAAGTLAPPPPPSLKDSLIGGRDTVFQEFFNQGIPGSWTALDVEGETVVNMPAGLSFLGSNWAANPQALSAAVVSGNYSVTRQPNDWLVSPEFVVGEAGRNGKYILEWFAESLDPQNPSGYSIKVCRNCSQPVSAGNAAALFDSTLFTTNAEASGNQAAPRRLDMSAFEGDTIRLAFQHDQLGSWVLALWGMGVFQIPENDVAVSQVLPPQSRCGLTTDSVLAFVDNIGHSDQPTVNLNLLIDNQVERTFTIDNLAANDFTAVVFNNLDFSEEGRTYQLQAATDLGGTADENPANDTSALIPVTHLAPNDLNPPLTNGFEPDDDFRGWITNDLNQDGYRWQTGLFGGSAFEGQGLVFYGNPDASGPPQQTANDWLYLPCLQLQSGLDYKLTYQLSTIGSHRYQVRLGTAPNPDSMNNLLLDFPSVNTNENYQEVTKQFQVAESGVYYLGFRALSSPGEPFILMDNLSLGLIQDHDLRVQSLQTPANACGLGTEEAVSAEVENTGQNPFSGAELMLLKQGQPVDTVAVSNLQPGQSEQVVFSGIDLSQTNTTFQLQAVGLLPNDNVPTNDSSRLASVSNIAPWILSDSTFQSGFEFSEPQGRWTTADQNEDNTSWIRFNDEEFALAGSAFFGYVGSPVQSANDWLLSSCFATEAGKQYDLRFWVRQGGVADQSLRFFTGSAPNPDSMNQQIEQVQVRNAEDWQKISLRFTASSGGIRYLGIQVNSAPNDGFVLLDQLTFAPAPAQDAAINEVITPVSACLLSASETIRVVVDNPGTEALNAVPVSLRVNSLSFNQSSGPIPAGASDTLVFSGVDLSQDDLYRVQATAGLSGDELPSNDSLARPAQVVNVTSDPLATEQGYRMSFEPDEPSNIGWSSLDANGDGVGWQRYFDDQLAHNGDYFFGYGDIPSVGGSADDWLFSTCIEVVEDSVYDLSFWYSTFGGSRHSMELWMGTAQKPDSMNQQLLNLPDISLQQFQQGRVRFTAQQTGTVFFGWHMTTSLPHAMLFLDQVRIRQAPTQDLALVELLNPDPERAPCPDPSANFRVVVENRGTQALGGGKVDLGITGPSLTFLEESLGTMAPGQRDTLTFGNAANLSQAGRYNFSLVAELSGDGNSANDSLNISYDISPRNALIFREDFDQSNGSAPPRWWTGAGIARSEGSGFGGSNELLALAWRDVPGSRNLLNSVWTSPRIGPMEAGAHLVFDYRWGQTQAYPTEAYAPQAGDSVIVEVSANCGPFQQVHAITASNHSATNGFNNLRIPLSGFESADYIQVRLRLRLNSSAAGIQESYTFGVDNFTVRTLFQNDMTLEETSIEPSEYSITPLSQAQARGFSLQMRALNQGAQTQNDLQGRYTVRPGTFGDSVDLSQLPSGGRFTLGTPEDEPFIPAQADTFTASFSVSSNQTDDQPADNQKTRTIVVDRWEYARDEPGDSTFTLELPPTSPNNPLTVGQFFDLATDDTLRYVKAKIGSLDGPVALVGKVYRASSTGIILTPPVGTTDTLRLSEDQGQQWHRLRFAEAPVIFSNDMLVALEQVSGKMNLQASSGIFRPNVTRLKTSRSSEWTSLEAFTSGNFRGVLQLRVGLGDSLSTGLAKAPTSSGPAMTVFPNPAAEHLQVRLPANGPASPASQLLLFDMLGRKALDQSLAPGQSRAQLELEGLPAGPYWLLWTNGHQRQQRKILIAE